MNQIPIKLGPLTLLLTIISICLTVLAILTFTTARADESLALKYADTVKTRYALEAEGQAFLQSLEESGAPASGTETDREGVTWKSFERDGSTLRIGFVTENGRVRIVSWRQSKAWEEDTSINIWSGN